MENVEFCLPAEEEAPISGAPVPYSLCLLQLSVRVGGSLHLRLDFAF